MAFKHGKAAAISVNAVALGTFFESIETSFDTDLADTTTFGSTWKSGLTGVPGGTIELSGYYDPTATTGPGAVLFPLLTAGTAVTILFYPGGNVSGQSLYTITSGGIVTAYAENPTVGGIITIKATIAIVILPVRSVI